PRRRRAPRSAARTLPLGSGLLATSTSFAGDAEIEKPVRLVAGLDSRGPQRDIPVAATRRIVLFHPVVGNERERAFVEQPGALERRQDLADTSVAVAYRRGRDLRIWAAFVHRGVGEREVAPHEA